MIRVLVAEDSPTMRQFLLAILAGDPEIEVIDVAVDGEEAVTKAIALRPDIITMDYKMPRLDGVSAIRAIMNAAPTPIVVLCSNPSDRALNISFNALKAGALDVMEKPRLASPDDLKRFRKEFTSNLKLMAEIKVVRIMTYDEEEASIFESLDTDRGSRVDVVGICSSTGGPAALEYVFRHLPRDFPAPIVVVQHIADGFLHGLVDWLNLTSALRASVAEDGERIEPGRIYFAPEGSHLAFSRSGQVCYTSEEPVRCHRPAGDIMFASMADWYASRAIGVVLTGMGEDGATGVEAMKGAGGIVLAQDEESSIVYGMPRAVVERGVATEVVSLEAMSERIVFWTYRGDTGDLNA